MLFKKKNNLIILSNILMINLIWHTYFGTLSYCRNFGMDSSFGFFNKNCWNSCYGCTWVIDFCIESFIQYKMDRTQKNPITRMKHTVLLHWDHIFFSKLLNFNFFKFIKNSLFYIGEIIKRKLNILKETRCKINQFVCFICILKNFKSSFFY